MVSPHAEHHRLELACVFACSPHPTPVPDVAKGKAATQRVFTIIDRQPLIDAASQVGRRVCGVRWHHPQAYSGTQFPQSANGR